MMTIFKMTAKRFEKLTDLGSYGICLKCGKMQKGCEPDARHYDCKSKDCNTRMVFGLEEALMMGRIELT